MTLFRILLFVFFCTCFSTVYAQQDMELHLNKTLLPGKNILKVKRNFNDPYLWVLAQNNEVFRINSLDNTVDDYTAAFSAYNNLQFIDIAGRSSDTVFVATNSANVLEYKKGAIKVLGSADGVAGIVNSIGIDNVDVNNILGPKTHIAVIATDHGICNYDFLTETMMPVTVDDASRILDMTYRTVLLHGLNTCRCYADTVDKYDLTQFAGPTEFGGEIWLNDGVFGRELRTAFIAKGSIYGGDDYPLYANQFWATENGLFQNYWSYSYTTFRPDAYRRYLKGVKINKITSIYGLAAFPQRGINGTRENLLIGTETGLYFSNSKYRFGGLATYEFVKFDGLAETTVNDICVNANTYEVRSPYLGTICEDGIWVAAQNGLYLLKPDYVPFVDQTQVITAIQFDGPNFQKTEVQTCTGETLQASILNYVYGDNTVQWYKDGVEMPNASGRGLNITQSGDYSAILYDPCTSVHFSTNHLKVIMSPGPVFSFNYPDKLRYCAGSDALLKTDDNPNYQYRWYKDGAIIPGITAASAHFTENGRYKVEVSGCTDSWVPSKEVELEFVPVPKPIITADKPARCAGEQAILSAAVPIDASAIINWQPYTYRWYKNSTLLPNESAATLKTKEAGNYKVEATSCASNQATSEDFKLDFITIEQPLITAGKPGYCEGDNATLATNFVNDGTYTIDWFRDGVSLPSERNKKNINTTLPGAYTVSVSSNVTSCTQTSVPYTLKFDAPPALTIERIVTTTLCDGQSVDLKATYSGGSIKWITGETADKISVNRSGTYSATVQTTGGCVVSKDINLAFFPRPQLNVPNATLCQFTGEQLTLTAPAGFVKYKWNDVAGTETFVTDKLGSVKLTVTDANGCEATQTIQVTSHCKDIHVPNTFSPNGDGVNDRWTIAGLEGDVSGKVQVYNRSGALVFESKGYDTPWNGTYKGKQVTAGVYYYLITANGSSQVLSGSLTVVY